MIKKLSFSLVALALFNISIYAESFDYKLSPKKVSDNVWCFLGVLEGPSKTNAGAMVNTCYIKTTDSFVLVDSGPSYQYASQAYEAMSKIAKLPVKTVITTHEHDDHWLGNSFYKDKFNAEIIGPKYINDHYKAGDKTRMFRVLPQNAIKDTKIIKVDKTPDKTVKMTIGGEDFEMIPIGQKAHTEEDFFIYMPKRKVLFAGDLAMNGRITSNRHGSLLGQLKAIEMMKSKEYEVFVPGHGLNTGKNAMDDAEKYFTLLHKRILKAIEDGVEEDEITAVVTMDEFKDRAMFKALNPRNVSDAFTEIEFAED
ncbi:MBL fold metallo-hydrolase [Sulfurovum sp. bin170]|uniref:MBL fold metallo-hydrolase n=1 Tax=Sulfurovum sp. bin170 TaxID=2695268 RepID=UPI0013DE9C4F|nr:MBL fold metallo-hydrolase [Sulfurovum sp. bin170]NEW61508.1 MBL fold metallo-hydrolase [Sulfurovum sp. bin170]